MGRNDPAWTFGPDTVAGSVEIRDSVFEDTPNGLLAGDLSDVRVIVDESVFRRVDYGVSLWTNYSATDLDAIGYPAGVPSRVTIKGSTFEDTAAATVWMDEYLGPSHVDLRVNSNDFILDGPPQLGLLGTAVEGARIVGNSFSGEGYAGVVALGPRGGKSMATISASWMCRRRRRRRRSWACRPMSRRRRSFCSIP